MIESSNKIWNTDKIHEFILSIEIPTSIEKFTIQVRGALRTREVPSYGEIDQQGYFTKQITINVFNN